MNDEKTQDIVNARNSEAALKEKAMLKELNAKPLGAKFLGYTKLSGPGFMNAAFTLGAGSFASSVTMGAAYGYDMLTTSIGKSDYVSVIISSAAEFVFYAILLVLSATAISKLAYNHTGIERENPRYSKVDEDYHRKMTRDVWTWFACALLSGGAKLVDTVQRYFADTTLVAVENDVGLVTSGLFPWFNIVTFGTTVLFISYSLYLFGKLKEEVTLKYS